MPRTVAIIGTGQVGMACAYSLMIQQVVDNLILVDINREKALGEAMDLIHGIPFLQPMTIRAGELADCQGAEVVVITAGAKQRQGETRLDLVQRNVEIFRSLIPEVTRHCAAAILLVVSNPVDIMSYVTWRLSGLPWARVMGSGTILDTARFRAALAERFRLDPRSLHAYIIGEHGDTEVPVWSKVHVAGTPAFTFFPEHRDPQVLEGIAQQVRNAAYEIIQRKGATSYAIGLGVTQIIQAILRDQKRVLTVSSLLQGEYGLEQVYLSLPTVVGSQGIERLLPIELSETELVQLRHSAAVLRQVIVQLGF
ncbi:MAG: L-lactate dehydrogenase [Thermostichales cyanobacterium SRBZ-1_bins_19]